jgi:SAM-dependent methyltransferase
MRLRLKALARGGLERAVRRGLSVPRPSADPAPMGIFQILAYPVIGSLEWLRRHSLILAELEGLRLNLGASHLTVLDFGGGDGALARVIRLYGLQDHYRVILADVDEDAVAAAGHDGIVAGAILIDPSDELAMADAAVDVAVSSDVFEHIPPTERARWLGELSRVARLGQIHTFPADSADGTWVSTATDCALDQWYRQRFGQPERWTADHLMQPEPRVEEMTNLLDAPRVKGFANASVWLDMVKNQLGSRGAVSRIRFSMRYLVRLRRRDIKPPFKGCLLVAVREVPAAGSPSLASTAGPARTADRTSSSAR